jgi:hypothetical protein
VRLDDEPLPVTLHAEGILVETVLPEESDGKWTYASFTVPRDLVRAEEMEITITAGTVDESRSFVSYHYWFLQ